MSVQVEKLEGSEAKLTIEVSAESFEESMQQAFLKNKNRFNIPGFRKGKAPRKFIEKMYGPAIFYEDAANDAINKSYKEAFDEASKELSIVSQPSIDVTQIESGKNFIYTAKVATRPEVTLGEYKGVEVEKSVIDVAEDEIEDEIKKVADQNSRTLEITDRPVEQDDIAVIDFKGFIDGEAFEGGEASDYELGIGSHSFIDTFEDQIIGHSIGDEFDVNVTFPENYGNADLSGKAAVFKVKVKAIKAKEVPVIDDEFASDVSEFDTLEEYKADLKKKLVEKKEKQAVANKRERALLKAVGNATLTISPLQINDQAHRQLEGMARELQQQNISMDMYLQYTGMKEEDLLERFRPQAEGQIKNRLVLEEIVKAENIEATEEELENRIKEMAEQYKLEADKVKEMMGEEGLKSLKEDVAVNKAIDLIADAAVEK